jgi:hypothetical protein
MTDLAPLRIGQVWMTRNHLYRYTIRGIDRSAGQRHDRGGHTHRWQYHLTYTCVSYASDGTVESDSARVAASTWSEWSNLYFYGYSGYPEDLHDRDLMYLLYES